MSVITTEERLIGGLIGNPDALETVSGRLTQAHFSSVALGHTFGLIQAMRDSGRPIEGLQVRNEMQKSGLLSRIGGDAALGRMAVAPTHLDAILDAADEIRNTAAMRRLAKLGQALIDASSDLQQKPQDIIRRIEAEASNIQAGSESDSLVSLSEATRTLIDGLNAPQDSKQNPVRTGLDSIDGALGGFFPGELLILAARPSIGKSALASQVGVSAAEDGGVLFVSLEMNARDIATRHLAAALRCEVRAVRSGYLNEDDLQQAMTYAKSIERLPMQIHFGRSCTISKIRGLARLMAVQPSGLKLVVVDYIGLMAATDRRKPRWEQVSELSADLKSLAQELSVPVLALSQLNRDAEGKPPTLAQLRDSGSLEQDADVVMLLHRAGRDASEAIVDIAKCRNGATGEIQLGFDPSTTTFSDLHAREWDS